MEVKMLTCTRFGGKRLNAGDTLKVDTVTAQRWSKSKIAEVISEPPGNNFSDLSAKALYAMCLKKGIKTEPKQQKEAYIKLLTSQE